MIRAGAPRRAGEAIARAAGALLPIGAAAVLAACAHLSALFPPDSSARPAVGVPQRFVAEAPAETGGPATCRSPLVDPRDGARLALHRSLAGKRGDYEVPAGRYGVGAGELLRVDCATGSAVGVVAR